MRKHSLKLLSSILFYLFSSNLFCQTDVVAVTTTGVGSTKENATKNALRNALESSFGAFISSKTEIVNDEILNDEITSISTGNIVSYEIVSSLFEENNHFVTVNSQVSLVRFSNYIQLKGHNVTFNGNSFAMNEKVQKFNRVSEEKTIKNVLTIFEDKLKKSVEFEINIIGNPKLSNNKKYRTKLKFHENVDLYELKMLINWGVNDNFTEAYKFLLESLKSLSMKKNELEYYYGINRDIYPIYLTDQVLKSAYNYKLREKAKSLNDVSGQIYTFGKPKNISSNGALLAYSGSSIFLRSKKSINFLLNSFVKTQSFIYNFKIEFGIDEFYPSKYIKTPVYKDLKIINPYKSTYINNYMGRSELINLYENDLLSTFKLSNNILPGIVTSSQKSLLYNKFTKSISAISNNLLVKQQIQNLEKIEDEIITESILEGSLSDTEDDVNFLEMDLNQFLNRENKKKELSLKNTDLMRGKLGMIKVKDSELKVKEIYPKLVLIPFKGYIHTNRLYRGGFSHEFNLFLTLDNLDKIKDVRIINLN